MRSTWAQAVANSVSVSLAVLWWNAARIAALSLSRTLAGDRPRLGAMNPNDPRDREALDRLGVKVYDLSDLSSASRSRRGS